jgi:uncharacterized membrane protein YjgN (DUF898 family)
MTSLWNDRWNRMSFGRQAFRAEAELGNLIVRWLAVFLVPIGTMLLLMLLAFGVALVTGIESPEQGAGVAIIAVAAVLSFYLVFLIATVSYYAAFYRQVTDATSWGGIDFRFTARTKDWLKLILGSIGLVIVTLGFGIMFLAYRNWSFAVRHLEATGEVNLDTLTQSTAAAPTDAEGLASAFDIGAV